jgi:hypothetical protein
MASQLSDADVKEIETPLLTKFCEDLGLEDSIKKVLASKDVIDLVAIEIALNKLYTPETVVSRTREIDWDGKTIYQMLAEGDLERIIAQLSNIIGASIRLAEPRVKVADVRSPQNGPQ